MSKRTLADGSHEKWGVLAVVLLLAVQPLAACGTAPGRTSTPVPVPPEGTATLQVSAPIAVHATRTPTKTATQTLALTATASPTPGIRAEGTANLFADNVDMQPISDGYIDLDTGAVNTPLLGDLLFLASYGTDLFFGLMPVNGASGAWRNLTGPGTPTPRLEDCARPVEFTAADLPIGLGDYVCVRTNGGRLSLVSVESVDVDTVTPLFRVGIHFVTWE